MTEETGPGAGEYVLSETDAGVGTITLNRPDRMNALIGTMREDLHTALSEMSADDGVRAIVIRGAGKAFCAGADVDAMAELVDRDDEQAFAGFMRAGMKIVRDIHTAPKPVIAALTGAAAGAGASLALACDVRIAAESARIGITFNRIGLHPDWGATYHLPRLVGPGRAGELIYSGRMVSAKEARVIGLFELVVPDAQFDTVVRKYASELAAKPTLAVQTAKATLLRGSERDLTEAMETEARAQLRLFHTDALREGVAAFREKRPPRFHVDRDTDTDTEAEAQP